jgi:hypothetical protein
MLDHIILTDSGYYSYADSGRLWGSRKKIFSPSLVILNLISTFESR